MVHCSNAGERVGFSSSDCPVDCFFCTVTLPVVAVLDVPSLVSLYVDVLFVGGWLGGIVTAVFCLMTLIEDELEQYLNSKREAYYCRC